MHTPYILCVPVTPRNRLIDLGMRRNVNLYSLFVSINSEIPNAFNRQSLCSRRSVFSLDGNIRTMGHGMEGRRTEQQREGEEGEEESQCDSNRCGFS